jgi:xylan 1,4-beta-xylosidase
LGETRLAAEGPALASRRADGSTAVLVWNLADVPQPSGIPGMTRTRPVKGDAKRLEIELVGARPGQAVRVRQVDQQQGSPLPAWRAMGSPQYPTREQLAQLRKSAEIAPAKVMKVNAQGRLVLELAPEGLALLELS